MYVLLILALLSSVKGNWIARPTYTDTNCQDYYVPFGRQYYLEDSCVPYGVDAAKITVNENGNSVLFQYCSYRSNCKVCDSNETYPFDQCYDEGENSIKYEYIEKWPKGDQWTANYIFSTKDDCEEGDPKKVKRGTVYSDFCTSFYGVNQRVKCYQGEVYNFYYNDTLCEGESSSKEKAKKYDCLEDIGGYSKFRCASFMKN